MLGLRRMCSRWIGISVSWLWGRTGLEELIRERKGKGEKIKGFEWFIELHSLNKITNAILVHHQKHNKGLCASKRASPTLWNEAFVSFLFWFVCFRVSHYLISFSSTCLTPIGIFRSQISLMRFPAVLLALWIYRLMMGPCLQDLLSSGAWCISQAYSSFSAFGACSSSSTRSDSQSSMVQSQRLRFQVFKHSDDSAYSAMNFLWPLPASSFAMYCAGKASYLRRNWDFRRCWKSDPCR